MENNTDKTTGKTPGEEQQQGVLEWNEFIQNTSFHGVKYVFERNHKLRRLLWLVAVGVAVALFVTQTGSRIGVYFQYTTNVDVKILYGKQIPFPSVTICNQNNYRITSTVDWNMYHLVEGALNRMNITEMTLQLEADLRDINTVEFVRNVAHQKHDLIDRCYWQGMECDISQNFNNTLTDLGVCYTFNSEDPPLLADKSGSNNGLRVLLNVEQYEYMRGPQIAAGVKIHLHDQEEVPPMKDRGFAVAPGTQNLVAVEMSTIKSLAAPHGNCDDQTEVSVSECQMRCKAEATVELCHCHDVYLKPEYNVTFTAEVCAIDKLLSCVPGVTEYMQGNHMECNCPVPCSRTLYKPNLSYSHLSVYNIEHFVMGDDENGSKEAQLKEKFHLAMETKQRYISEYVTQNEDMLKKLLDTEAAFLNRTHPYWDSFREAIDKVNTVLSTDVFLSVTETIEKSATDKGHLLTSVRRTSISEIFEIRKDIWKLMAFDFNSPVSKIVDFLNFCLNVTDEHPNTQNGDTDSRDIAVGIYFNTEVEHYPWINIQHYNQCEPLFTGFKTHFEHISFYDASHYEEELSSIDKAFINGTFNYTVEEGYEQCQTLAAQTKNLTNAFSTVLDFTKDLLRANNFSQALHYAEQIVPLYHSFLVPLSTYKHTEERLRDACQWTQNLFERTMAEVSQATSHVSKASDKYQETINIFIAVNREFGRLNDTMIAHITPFVRGLENYKSGNITKLELKDEFERLQVNDVLPKLTVHSDTISNFATELTVKLGESHRQLHQVFKISSSPKFPILNNYEVRQLEITRKAAEVDDPMSHVLADVNVTDLPFAVSGIISRFFNPHLSILLTSLISVDKMVSDLELLHRNLEDYKTSTEMGSSFYLNNYLQVDIFYQELSYEEIEQNIAFEFLSLLSEVGGFLGLLLGASVLTVCELLDYIGMSVISKIRKRKSQRTVKTS